jgi:tape measure domain-containing protein
VSVVANVAINVDSRNAVSKLRQFQQQSSAAGRAAQELQKTTNAASAAATKAGREYQTAANGMRFFIDATGRAHKENGQFVTTAEAAAAGLQKQGAAAKGAAGAMRSLGGVIASLGAGALVASMVRGAAAAEQLQLRLKLLSGEYGETARVQQFVSESAKTFGQSQIEAAGGVADVYARLRPLGVSLDQIETIYKGFNATALASGTSAEAASGAFLQLSQALGSGTLQGDEFRSVAEQVPGILRLVAGEMGVTVGELKKLGSEGKITSDVLINALAKGFDENSSKIKTLLDQSPAQRFKEFKDSTQALSNALGSELLPALIPIVKTATELLKLFGSLPGPVQTLIAAVFGLTAAFVALAPAISTAIGLLGGLSLATLAAAGPWVALAAGITAAAVALAGYRSEAQKVAGAAKTGTAADVVAARNLSVQKGQEISLLERQRKTASGPERAQIDRRLGRLRTDQSELQSAITASTADRPAAAVLPPAVTGGGAGAATSAGGGAGKASNEAEKLAQEIQRSLELGDRLGTEFSRQVLLLGEANETEKKRLQIQFDYEDRAKQIAELKNTEQQTNLNQLNDEIRRLEIIDLQTEALKKQLEKYYKLAELKAGDMLPEGAGAFRTDINLMPSAGEQQMAKYRKELEELTNPINMAVTGANAIGDAFGTAFQDIATGAKSTQEALADAFKSIGSAFISMATEIIAKQMAMIVFQTILKALGGGGGGDGLFSGAGPVSMPGGAGFAEGFSMPSLLPGRAMGGPVSGNQPYIVGERGPELFVPGVSGSVVSNADTRAALAQQATNRQGNDTRAMLEQQATNRQMNAGGNAMQQKPIEVKYESTVINGVEYVTAEQHQRGITLAAERGRALTLQTLQNSVKTRKRVGMA